jgi:predicted Zn-dependent protease
MHITQKICFTFIFILLQFLAQSCRTVPVSGRQQLALLPESTLIGMSLTSYNEFISSHRLSTNQQQTELVRTTGFRIANAVEEYLKNNGMGSRVSEFQWEFNLIEDDVVNAWAMPGGKIVFYTGILPVTLTAGGLAAVMGHEIAHVVARHGNERMSQQLLVQTGGLALAVAMREKPAETRNMFLAAYGVGTAVGVVLPYSRAHEREADRLGLIFMAMAGYNPQEALDFWERMDKMAGGAGPPAFLSTHPTSADRIREIRNFLPEAMKYYNPV